MFGELILLGGVLLLGSTAEAYSTLGYTWPSDAFPVPYAIASDLGSLDDVAAVESIQAAFQTWEEAGCGVSFAYQGRVSDPRYGGTPDGQNVVYFLDVWPEDSALVSSPAIFTQNGNELSEVDIALNGQSYAWVTDGADGRSLMDVQGSVTHEVGHLLGLWHSTVADASLNPALDGNPEARSLAVDDVEGLCALYGEQGVSGDGELGEDCVEAADCAEELLCLADGEDRYCTQRCVAGETCPEGYTCEETGDGGGVCAAALVKAGGCGCDGVASGAAGLPLMLAAAGAARRRRRPVWGHPG